LDDFFTGLILELETGSFCEDTQPILLKHKLPLNWIDLITKT
jgi:hypothetical protein